MIITRKVYVVYRGMRLWQNNYKILAQGAPAETLGTGNPTCGFPASGFPTGFISTHTAAGQGNPTQLQYAKFAEHRVPREAAGATRWHVVAPYSG
jgi:hypothetical protein